jgi:hypothetical protein
MDKHTRYYKAHKEDEGLKRMRRDHMRRYR